MPRTKTKLFAGNRLQHLRKREGLTQAAMAGQIGISLSYLNQLERNHRPLPPRLLQSLCERFDLTPAWFSDTREAHTIQALRETMADPVFKNTPLPFAKMTEAPNLNPDLCKAFLALYRAYSFNLERDSNTAEPLAPEPYEAVGNWVQEHKNYFHELDRAAEEFYEFLSPGEDHPEDALVRHLQAKHGLQIVQSPEMESKGLVWRIDQYKRTIYLPHNQPHETHCFFWRRLLASWSKAT